MRKISCSKKFGRKERMTTPTKNEIIDKAFEMNANRNYRINLNTPTENELKESGIYEEAKNELMRNPSNEYLAYVEKEAMSLGYRLTKEKNEHSKQIVSDPFSIDLEEAMRTGLFISGTSHSGKSNLAFVIADILMSHGVIVYLIDPSQAWSRYSSVPHVLRVSYPSTITYKDGHVSCSTIFDISRLTILQQKEVVEKFCKSLFETRVNSDYRPQTFIWFEEAHLFFPEGSMRSKRYQEALRIITTGRNFNIRFGLITQWCALIDKTVIKFPRQKYLGYSDEKNDKEYLRNFIGKRVDELETLEVGQFIYDFGKNTTKIQVPLFRCEPKSLLATT